MMNTNMSTFLAILVLGCLAIFMLGCTIYTVLTVLNWFFHFPIVKAAAHAVMIMINTMMKITMAAVVLFFLTAKHDTDEKGTNFWSHDVWGWKVGVLAGNLQHKPDDTPICRSGMIGFLWVTETDFNASRG
jgi:hypothetical protein